ncbi:PEP-CTERM sorting domain-containing protein [Adhaeretor mobilis]|uniref:Ice-binding protein C-terminal domain-containing protein n=1 Tax=Adhaeretor mobilis TaxID=1930276 RepID=A0A517MWC4_9BACT|nr:PEP-CTERM sorting domain-containing protein [Adhaeretor mobilis]QDS99185.1 hypothetical protein HG15A2_24770 [Adhaeretor mobilis]
MRHSISALCVCLSVVSASPYSSAQATIPLYSFETGLEGWLPQGGADSDYISHAQFLGNATDGSNSMQVVTGPGFGRDVQVDLPGSGALYDAFNQVAGDPSIYSLDFDVTFDANSWTNFGSGGNFMQLGVFANSDDGFQEVFGAGNATPGVTNGTVNVTVPMSQLPIAQASTFYNFGISTNSDIFGTGNFSYYVDNIRFSEIPTFVEKTLFSWETPDDLGTPGVNEQLEGWADGFTDQPHQHTRSIGTLGATDGSSSLTVVSPSSGFTWGSQFELNSDPTEGDPANQARINELISDINGAEKLAFDVTFPEDQMNLASPSFLSLFVNISDESGNFFQSPPKQAGDPLANAENTITIEIGMNEFTAGGMTLADTGLAAGNYFRFALATNADDAVDFFIDNFRILSFESTGLAGDFDGSGTVDGADFLLWQTDNGVGSLADWQTNYGMNGPSSGATSSAVPEPSSLLLLSLGMVLLRRRNR